MRRLAFGLLLAGCAHGGAAPAPSNTGTTAAPHQLLATLERFGCGGDRCPAYKISVYRDGAIEWQGNAGVAVKGATTGHVDATTVEQIEKLFTDVGYFSLADTYDSMDATDSTTVETSYHVGGKDKTINHYEGDMKAPEGLGNLEDALDQLVHSEQWVGDATDDPATVHGVVR